MSEKREIKTTLAIDGEKQFKAAMDEAFRGMKVLGSEMKLNTAIFGDNASSMEGLTKKGEILGKQIAQQKEIVAALSKAVHDSASAYGENDKRTDAYRIKLNNATAALSRMEGELEGNEQAIKDFGKETEDADTKTSKWNDALKKVTETLGKGVVVAAKATAAAVGAVAVAAGAAAVKLGREVVKEFGELEQNLGGAEAVFGEYADAIKKHGEEAYKSLGASQSDYLATANKMGALFQGSGIKQQKSLDLTVKAMQRAADMASVMGIDTQVALDSIAGAAKGNFTMMDNLGVAMNATTIEAYALSKGMKKSYKEMSNTEKTELAMQMFFEKTQQYAGNFAKEAEGTITGSIGMMKAATSSFIAGLGQSNADMTELTQNMVNSLNAVITNITPVLQNIVTALPAVVDTIVQNIGTMLPMLIEVSTGIFVALLNTIVEMLPELIPVAVAAISTITKALIDNMPMILDAANQLLSGLVVGITTALIGSMDELNIVAKEMYDMSKKRTREVNAQKDAYNNLKTAQAKQAESDLAQIRNTQNLWGELQGLADASGKVTASNKARAEYILGELNTAYGTEYSLVDGVITRYQTMQSEIDKLIEKRKYEVVQKAALPLFERAITDEIKLRMDAERDLARLEEAKAEREKAYTEVTKLLGAERSRAWLEEAYDYSLGRDQIIGSYLLLDDSVKSYEEAHAATTEAVKQNLADQTSYQSAEMLAQKGNYEEAYAVLSWYSSGLQQKYAELQGDQTAQREFLQKEYRLADAALRKYLDNVFAGVEEYNESTVRSLTANATDLYNKAKEGGVNVGDGLIAGMDAKKPGVTTSISDISSAIVTKLKDSMGIKSPSKVMKGIGENVVQGLEDGMNAKKSSVSLVAASIGNMLVETWKSIFGIKSPSTVMRDEIGKQLVTGLALGVTENARLVDKALGSVIPDASNMLDAVGNFNRVSGPVSVTGKSSLTVSLDDSALDRLAAKLADVINLDGAAVVLNDREMGRWVRKVVTA